VLGITQATKREISELTTAFAEAPITTAVMCCTSVLSIPVVQQHLSLTVEPEAVSPSVRPVGVALQ